jgi:hypothetical protein
MARRLDLWLPGYAAGTFSRWRARRARRDRLTHVFFLVCDHYEPRHKATHEGQAAERVATWRAEYPRFQQRCREQFGHAPLHTWFYPPHHGAEHLPHLAAMAHAGGGEVELHYHHRDDTAATLARDLQATLALYRRHGLLLESGAPPRTRFGFVHGDWTLDNACNGVHCGVNGELSLLAGLGCWADFTMPSANEAQTRKINAIYYAVDDPARHKSHDRGVDARVGRTGTPGFFLMQGPLSVNWRAPGYPRIENASLTSDNWGRPDRVRAWLDCQVHVRDRPEWLFVKLHTHGAVERDFDALFGDKAMRMHAALNEVCNDGSRYKLHYVTARQAYNLAKAAERGLEGDPRQYVDLEVGPPATATYALDVAHDVRVCTRERLRIDGVAGPAPALLQSRVGALAQLQGAWGAIDIDATAGSAGDGIAIEANAAGPLTLSFRAPVRLRASDDAAVLSPGNEAHDTWIVHAAAAGPLRLRCEPLALTAESSAVTRGTPFR